MVKVITKKDREYIDQLYVRNAKLMRSPLKDKWEKYEKLSHCGLSKPMTNKERQRRLRLKRKAYKLLKDLVMIDLSALMPKDFKVEEMLSVWRDLGILNMVAPDDGTSDIPKMFPKIE